MRARIGLVVAALVSSFFGVTVARAQEQTPVETFSVPQFGLLYQYQLLNTSGNKDSAGNDIDITKMDLSVLRLMVNGKILTNLSYAVRFQLEDTNPNNRLDFGYFTYNLTSTDSLIFGKAKVRAYGWEQRNSNPTSLVTSTGLSRKPYGYSDLLGWETIMGFGTFTFQLAKDTVPTCSPQILKNTGSCGGWNKLDTNGKVLQQQPAMFFEYTGLIWRLQPLVQLGTYDMGHSRVSTVGLRLFYERVLTEVDVTQHLIAVKGIAPGATKASQLDSTEQTAVINISYEGEAYRPFLHYSTYNIDEYAGTGQSKSDVNSSPSAFDDNGKTVGLGVEWTQFKDKFRPYVALVQKSAQYVDAAAAKKDLAVKEVKVGVRGQF